MSFDELSLWLARGLEGCYQQLNQFTKPTARMFLPYWLTAGAFAFVVFYRLSKRDGTRPLSGGFVVDGEPRVRTFLQFMFPRRMYRHVWSDVGPWLVWAIAMGFIFGPALFGLPDRVREAIASVPGIRELVGAMPEIDNPIAAACLVAILRLLAIDAGFTLWHVLTHRIGVLWEFHKVHHSAQVMSPLTQLRLHPLDTLGGVLLTSVFSLPAFAVQSAVTRTAYPEFQELVFPLTAVALATTGLTGILRHSHVWLRYPKWLSYVFTSPAMHQMHHSSEKRHFDINFGFIFAFWDIVLGTLYVPARDERFVIGLSDEEGRNTFGANDAGVFALLVKPFVLAGRRLVGTNADARKP